MNRLPTIIRQHIAAFRAMLVFTVITGLIYPVFMWGVAQAAFKNQADGSPVSYNGKVVGSSLLCQEFVDAKGNPLPQYFQERPSDADSSSVKDDYGCDPGFSAASNLGPNSPTLLQDVQQRRAAIAKFDGVSPSQVPPVRAGPRPGRASTRTSRPSTPTSRSTRWRPPGTCRSPWSGSWSASTPRAGTSASSASREWMC